MGIFFIKHVKQIFSAFRINHHVKPIYMPMFTTNNEYTRDLMSIGATSRIKLSARAILNEKEKKKPNKSWNNIKFLNTQYFSTVFLGAIKIFLPA